MHLTVLFLLTFFLTTELMAQTEALLQYRWKDTTAIELGRRDQRYNEVWGLSQDGREYAVIGSTMGTHFIDISDPDTLYEVDFIRGKFFGSSVVHRDFHDYEGYLYSVCDQGSSSLQVIDLRYLPDSVVLVHEDAVNISRSHNVFIDSATAKMYTCGVRAPNVSGRIPLQLWSLENPEEPELMKNINQIEGLPVSYVHDMYARNDTVFLNAANQGLYIADFTAPDSPQVLGTLLNYPQKGYNHSGWWNESGDYYFMADETHGRDLKIVETTEISSPRVANTFEAESDPEGSVPHNLIVKNNRVYVSYYYDGLQVFDFSESGEMCRSYKYATSELNPVRGGFSGAWGVYPLLPSERVLVSDMQNGLFVLRLPEEQQHAPYDGEGTPPCDIASHLGETADQQGIQFIHSPQHQIYRLEGQSLEGNLRIWDATGRQHFDSFVEHRVFFNVPVDKLPKGMYFMSFETPHDQYIFKFYTY